MADKVQEQLMAALPDAREMKDAILRLVAGVPARLGSADR